MSFDAQEIEINDATSIPFGTRLSTAREARRLSTKDIAAQLRLNEDIILMLEKGVYPPNLPIVFLRGYIRAYTKLLDIPDHEVMAALLPIQPKVTEYKEPISYEAEPETAPSQSYFLHVITYVILTLFVGLACVWWYSHNAQPAQTSTINIAPPAPEPLTVTEPTQVAPAPIEDTSLTKNIPAKPIETPAPIIVKPVASAPHTSSNFDKLTVFLTKNIMMASSLVGGFLCFVLIIVFLRKMFLKSKRHFFSPELTAELSHSFSHALEGKPQTYLSPIIKHKTLAITLTALCTLTALTYYFVTKPHVKETPAPVTVVKNETPVAPIAAVVETPVSSKNYIQSKGLYTPIPASKETPAKRQIIVNEDDDYFGDDV